MTQKNNHTELRLVEVGKMRKTFLADPDTDQERFYKACLEAEDYAKRSNYDTIVFKNPFGFYMVRELKFSLYDISRQQILPLYCALARLCATQASIRKVAWKLRPDHKTR